MYKSVLKISKNLWMSLEAQRWLPLTLAVVF